MKETSNAIELANVSLFFDNNHLYIGPPLGTPIVIKNISPDMVAQIGDFFYYYGKNYYVCAKRIDFPDLSIRIEKTIIYFITEKLSLMIDSMVPSDIKKIGIWLRKKK